MTIEKKKTVTETTKEQRQPLVDIILDSLKKGVIPWQKSWVMNSSSPVNAVTKFDYTGINNFTLSVHAMAKNYGDPRWVTYKQAHEKGWQVNQGEKGVKIECWKLYNNETHKIMNWNDYTALSAEEKQSLKGKIQWCNYPAVVFNASQVKGIPELNNEEKTNEITGSSYKLITSNLINNMKLKTNLNATEACYIPSADKICMPNAQLFKDAESYYSVMLHEIGHATGHESRLKRQISGSFGSKEYAKEELRAEISSMFLSQEIGLKMNDQHIETHQAYIQNWISVLENNPEELFNSIKDAQKISDYLIEKGDIVKIKELDHANSLEMEEEKPKSYAEILKNCTKEQIEQQRISFEGAKLILEYQEEQFRLDGEEEYLAVAIKGINQMQENLALIAEIQGVKTGEAKEFEMS